MTKRTRMRGLSLATPPRMNEFSVNRDRDLPGFCVFALGQANRPTRLTASFIPQGGARRFAVKRFSVDRRFAKIHLHRGASDVVK